MKKTKSKKASNNISANISFKEATFSQTANRLEIETGTYYHFAHNLHLYNDKLNEK